jgi:hypothetical protein
MEVEHVWNLRKIQKFGVYPDRIDDHFGFGSSDRNFRGALVSNADSE